MKSKAVVIGAGGHARVIGASLRSLGVEIAGFVDPVPVAGRQGATVEMIAEAPVMPGVNALEAFSTSDHDAFIALGDNAARKDWHEKLRTAGYNTPALVHANSCLSPGVRIGEAACVCIGATLCAEVIVGTGAIVNTGVIVDHESDIGAFVHIAPGVAIAGRVRVGEGTFIGMGARVADGLSIGPRSVVGAGSVVLKDVSEGAKIVGVHH